MGLPLNDYIQVVTCSGCGKPAENHLRRYECTRCERTVYTDRPARYCMTECQQAEKIDRRRSARRLARRKRCATCDNSYTATRVDGTYCSSACRQRAYRSRLAAAARQRAENARMIREYEARLQ